MPDKIEIPDKPFLRVDEFAEIMGVSRQTVHNWINGNKVLYVKIAGTIRINRISLFNQKDHKAL